MEVCIDEWWGGLREGGDKNFDSTYQNRVK